MTKETETVHFYSGDERFCGSRKENRRFSFNAHEVNCRACMSCDTVRLTPQGEQTLAEIMRRNALGI